MAIMLSNSATWRCSLVIASLMTLTGIACAPPVTTNLGVSADSARCRMEYDRTIAFDAGVEGTLGAGALKAYEGSVGYKQLLEVTTSFDTLQRDYAQMALQLCEDSATGAVSRAYYERRRECLDQAHLALRALSSTLGADQGDATTLAGELETKLTWIGEVLRCDSSGSVTVNPKLEQKAKLAVSEGRVSEALGLYDALIEHNRRSPAALEYLQARLALQRKQGDAEAVETEINRISEALAPEGPWYQANKSKATLITKADDLVATNLFALAEGYERDARTRALAAKPSESRAREVEALTLKAARYYRGFLDRLPAQHDAYNAMVKGAIQAITSAYVRFKRFDALERWVRGLIAARNLKVMTMDELERTLELAINERARDLMAQKRYDDAIKVLRQLMVEMGGDDSALATRVTLNIGLLHREAGRFSEAAASYKRVIARDGSTRHAVAAAHFEIARLYEVGRLENTETTAMRMARSLYERACTGKHMEACHRLAILYVLGKGGTKDERRGRQLINKACEGGWSDACAAQDEGLKDR